MKLVELLAKELDAWPAGNPALVQGSFGQVYICGGGPIMLEAKKADDWELAEVTCAQWQAERDRQKGGEWKRHRGNSQPVDEGTWVEVKLRCGDIQQGLANAFLWRHADCDVAANIMKFRVISQPQAEEVEVDKFCMGENCNATAESIAHSHECEAEHEASYTGAWDQMETPFKWRDEITELNAYIEKYTRERDALIERLASEGFALIQKINLNLDKIDATLDMSDWRNWKEGDVIEVIANKGCHQFEIGNEVTVINIDEEDSTYRIEATAGGNDWWLAKSDGKFIRRP